MILILLEGRNVTLLEEGVYVHYNIEEYRDCYAFLAVTTRKLLDHVIHITDDWESGADANGKDSCSDSD